MDHEEAIAFDVFEKALEEAAKRDAKRRRRALVKRQREALTEEYMKDADAKIAAAVTGSEAFRRAEAVFCYVSVPGEPDTAPVIEAALEAGKQVAVPRCIGKGVMEAVLISSRADLCTGGKFGIPEPAAGLPVIEPESLDLLLVPCVACTRSRARLGHGMGYYDRFMEKADGTSMALCYAQLLQERIPEEAHDRRPDIVVSEEAIYTD